MNPFCQTTGSKTLEFKVFSTHVVSMVQDVLPTNLPQNTADYSVFHLNANHGAMLHSTQVVPKHCNSQCFPPNASNGKTLLAKQLAPKHWNLQCFLPMLVQWFKISCLTACSKTLEFAVFFTRVGSMVQGLFLDSMFQTL